MSPGAAIRERDTIERDVSGYLEQHLRALLDAAAWYAEVALYDRTSPWVFNTSWLDSRWNMLVGGISHAYESEHDEHDLLANTPMSDRIYDSVIAAHLQHRDDRAGFAKALTTILSEQTATAVYVPDSITAAIEFEGMTWLGSLQLVGRIFSTSTSARLALAAARLTGATHKRWVSRHDDKTRPSHLEADGQTVLMNQPFEVGGVAMRRPGDPRAPIEEIANCRCVVVGVER